MEISRRELDIRGEVWFRDINLEDTDIYIGIEFRILDEILQLKSLV